MSTGKNETQWSAAYTIETPKIDICGETMLIYEQQGYQVEVVDTAGRILSDRSADSEGRSCKERSCRTDAEG